MARASVDGRERVVIHSLVADEATLLPLPPDAQIEWFDWAGEGRVLVSLGWTRTIDGDEAYVTRLFVFDLATKDAENSGRPIRWRAGRRRAVRGPGRAVVAACPAGVARRVSDRLPLRPGDGRAHDSGQAKARRVGVVCRLGWRGPCRPRLPGQVVVHALSQERRRAVPQAEPCRLRGRFGWGAAARPCERLGRRLPALGPADRALCALPIQLRDAAARRGRVRKPQQRHRRLRAEPRRQARVGGSFHGRPRSRAVARSGHAREPGEARSPVPRHVGAVRLARRNARTLRRLGWRRQRSRLVLRLCACRGRPATGRAHQWTARSGPARSDRVHALQGA